MQAAVIVQRRKQAVLPTRRPCSMWERDTSKVPAVDMDESNMHHACKQLHALAWCACIYYCQTSNVVVAMLLTVAPPLRSVLHVNALMAS